MIEGYSVFTLQLDNSSKHKQKTLPEYLSSSQRCILSPGDSRNCGTIINKWARGQTHWYKTDSQMRNTKSISHKGLIDIICGKEYEFQGRQLGRKKAGLWL